MIRVLVILSVIVVAIIIYFKMPYSKTRTEFEKSVNSEVAELKENNEIFTEEDIKNLPSPVQKYFRYCGFIGKPKMSYMKASFKNVDFKMSPDKTIKIDYTQYNFVHKPSRLAFIDSSIYGIPFEGFDSYINGTGSMKGRLGKIITLFDQRGESMDKACLVTFLAEALINPNTALQNYIKWEEIDDLNAKATINYKGNSAGGIFTFDENGAMISFVTNDRIATAMDGSTREAEWLAIIGDYHEVNGMNLPKTLISVWRYPEGDFVYFNENKSEVEIEYPLGDGQWRNITKST